MREGVRLIKRSTHVHLTSGKRWHLLGIQVPPLFAHIMIWSFLSWRLVGVFSLVVERGRLDKICQVNCFEGPSERTLFSTHCRIWALVIGFGVGF
jgi:hypothetical protein